MSRARTTGRGGSSGEDIQKIESQKKLIDSLRLKPPPLPEYEAFLATKTQAPIEAELAKLQSDPRAMAQFRQEALRSAGSQSPFERLAALQQRGAAAQQRDELRGEAAAGQAQTLANLAERGGLSAGARERTLRGSQGAALASQQRVGAGLRQGLLGIASESEKNRLAQLGALPGMEIQQLEPGLRKTEAVQQARQFDINQEALEKARKQIFNLQKYSTQANIYGGKAASEAQLNNGGGKK